MYYDLNFRKRHVFSAIAEHETGILNFDEDLKPLFDFILENPENIANFTEDPWLGIVEFGSETWISDGNVTFTAANFAMDIEAEGPGSGGDGSGDGSGNGGSPDGGSGAGTIAMSVLGFAVPAALMMGAVFA